jgi:hypothetical protein
MLKIGYNDAHSLFVGNPILSYFEHFVMYPRKNTKLYQEKHEEK